MNCCRLAIPFLLLIGCAAEQDTVETRLSQSALSPVGLAVLTQLTDSASALRGRTWDLSYENGVTGDWILETPCSDNWSQLESLPVAERCTGGADCEPSFGLRRCQSQSDCSGGGVCAELAATVTHPGQQPMRLCTGHSDSNLDEFYRLIVSAEAHVDITSLTPADGRYLAALRNAISFLSSSGRHVTIRLAYGTYPSAGVVVDDFRDELVRDLEPWSGVEIWVGAYRYGFTSWNHAKIVAVDGHTAIVGGMNMWDQHYLEADPVFDLSMRLSGPAVADTHAFANELWHHLCYGWSWFGTKDVARFPRSAPSCPPEPVLTPSPAAGAMPVFTVARLGAMGEDPSDDAILAMLASARETIYLSIQDLGPMRQGWITLGSWPEPLLTELVSALARGVDLYVIVSNLDATPGGLSSGSAGYSNGWTPTETARAIADRAHAMAELFPAGADIDAELCDHLHLAPLRPGTAATWPSGASFANHAKTVFVDDLAFYVGSQNLYPADLAELGFIVDDAAATAELVDTYWWPLWSASSAAAVSGSEATSCQL